jgi:hypothetical protein
VIEVFPALTVPVTSWTTNPEATLLIAWSPVFWACSLTLLAVPINTDAATAETSIMAMKIIIVPTPISPRLSRFNQVFFMIFTDLFDDH